MSIILEDSALNTYTLAANFKIKGTPFRKRSKISTIAYREGGRNTSDKKVDVRTVEIEGILRGTDTADYLTKKNTLFKWLNKEDLKLYYQADRYINVTEITNIQHDFFDGSHFRIAKVAFTCECDDPFWYYVALNTFPFAMITSPQVFTVWNLGDYFVSPVITILNTADNTNLTLTNLTDNLTSLNYADIAFLNGLLLEINNDIGTVKRGQPGINTIDKMTGNFLKLLPGVNTFTYTGATCSIVFKWYNREL